MQQRRRHLPLALAVLAGLLLGGAGALWLRRAPAAVDARAIGEALPGTVDGPDVGREHVAAELVPMVEGVGQPTDLAFVPGHDDKLVVVSKWGSLHLVDLGTGTRTNWIWLPVLDALECGVLGLAFAPDFAESGRFWVHQCPRGDDDEAVTSAVTELRTDPASLGEPEVVGDVLTIDQPYGTHNGGQIAFGPDGMLYVALGDGWAGTPDRRSQDRSNLLGSVLRLDVSAEGAYGVPFDNPFVGQDGVRPEIWAYGLRNPWRMAFDEAGRAIVADVGEASWEEINVVRAGDNLGWPDREGRVCFRPANGCPEEGRVEPAYVYGHDEGISITGGVDWRADGELRGAYVFGDFGTGRIWAVRLPEQRGPVEDAIALGRFDISPSAFTRAPDGGVWVADFRSERVFRIAID